jgi:PTS system nitrogen regulatory IIA component
MEIYNVLKEKACSASLTSRTKKECLLELSRLITAAEAAFPLEEVLTALEEREEQGSTAFGEGVAIPHARLKGSRSFAMGIGVSKKGIDFQSLDGKKSHLFFVLLGPENKPQDYLTLLAQISRVAKDRDAQKELRRSRSPSVLREIFLRHVGGVKPKASGKKKLFVLVLYEKQYLDDILELFLELGIRGASVSETTGVRDVLSKVPLFADLLNFLGERKQASKTITTIIDENELSRLVEGIEGILGDLDTHSGALVYALDVPFMKGSLEVL